MNDTGPSKRKRSTEEERRVFIEMYHASGEGLTVFCQKHNLKPPTLAGWLKGERRMTPEERQWWEEAKSELIEAMAKKMAKIKAAQDGPQ